MASYKDSVIEHASSLTASGCSSRKPGLLLTLPRLDSPERGHDRAGLVRSRQRTPVSSPVESGEHTRGRPPALPDRQPDRARGHAGKCCFFGI